MNGELLCQFCGAPAVGMLNTKRWDDMTVDDKIGPPVCQGCGLCIQRAMNKAREQTDGIVNLIVYDGGVAVTDEDGTILVREDLEEE